MRSRHLVNGAVVEFSEDAGVMLPSGEFVSAFPSNLFLARVTRQDRANIVIFPSGTRPGAQTPELAVDLTEGSRDGEVVDFRG